MKACIPTLFVVFGYRPSLFVVCIELFFCFDVGGNLLSHNLPVAVPSARAGLASGFGMGPGVSLSLSTTDKHAGHHPPWVGCACAYCVRYCIVDANTCRVFFFLFFVHGRPHNNNVCGCVCFGLLVPVALTLYSAYRSGLSTP